MVAGPDPSSSQSLFFPLFYFWTDLLTSSARFFLYFKIPNLFLLPFGFLDHSVRTIITIYGGLTICQVLCGALDIEKVSRHSFADEDILGSSLSLCLSSARQSGCLYFRMNAGSPQGAPRKGCTSRGEESCDNFKRLFNCLGDLEAP